MNTAKKKAEKSCRAENSENSERSAKKRVSRRATVCYAAALFITVLAIIVLSYFASNRLGSRAESMPLPLSGGTQAQHLCEAQK